MSTRVAFIGHVDHGKSTVIGRLLSDTGQTTDGKKEKVSAFCQATGRKFEFAFLLDGLEEEQAQGITIDVTEAAWNCQGREFTFVDTPGHREFIKKMVGGASRVDAAVLVVDAQEGIVEAFHRQMSILDLLGVRERIVLINKMDLVGWSEAVWEKLRSEIHARVRLIPISAWHGENLTQPSEHMPWYDGPTLAQALLSLPHAKTSVDGPLRFLVQDTYKFDEKRIYVGRVESGRMNVGDEIQFYPSGLKAGISSIEFHGEERASAIAGDAIGLTLSHPLFLDRGAVGFSPGSPPKTGRKIHADLFWLDQEPLRVGEQLKIKSGTQETLARVSQVHFEIDRESFLETRGGNELSEFGQVSFVFDQPWVYDDFEACEVLGRFVIVKGGKVLGGGRWAQQKNLFSETSQVTRQERERRLGHRGHVFWLTGLSGSGKSTLAKGLERTLFDSGINSVVLDGDNIRQGLSGDLDFTDTGRDENLRRVAETAKLMREAGLVVITAFISPMRSQRDLARRILGPESFSEIFVDCPMAVCESRDPKGLYRQARSGSLAEFTGVSAPFEAPESPELRVETASHSIQGSTAFLVTFVAEKAKL